MLCVRFKGPCVQPSMTSSPPQLPMVLYDPQYALRLCAEQHLEEACVHIYAAMGLYEEAVERALLVREGRVVCSDNHHMIVQTMDGMFVYQTSTSAIRGSCVHLTVTDSAIAGGCGPGQGDRRHTTQEQGPAEEAVAQHRTACDQGREQHPEVGMVIAVGSTRTLPSLSLSLAPSLPPSFPLSVPACQSDDVLARVQSVEDRRHPTFLPRVCYD